MRYECQKPFICISPRLPPFGSLRFIEFGVQFDSRLMMDSKTVRWSAGQPRLTANAENCSQALEYGSMKIVELVVVVGAIRYGSTLIGAVGMMLEASEWALGAPRSDANPHMAVMKPAMSLGAVNCMMNILSSGTSTLGKPDDYCKDFAFFQASTASGTTSALNTLTCHGSLSSSQLKPYSSAVAAMNSKRAPDASLTSTEMPQL